MITDPKPLLGSAAVQANIDYYLSKIREARQAYKKAKQELKYWQNYELSNHTEQSKSRDDLAVSDTRNRLG
jgi:hypothetical protein